jgi:hypothetical protein
MSLPDILNVVAAGLLSLGTGGAIIFGLSSWLGKVWANRLMESERAKHAQDLEKLRVELQHHSKTNLASMKSDLEIYKAKHLKGHEDKLAIYRLATNVVVDILGDLDVMMLSGKPPVNAAERLDRFNRGRMKAYGYLAMLAPQNAMDGLMDHIILLTQGKEKYEWSKVRELVLALLNEVRKDIGIDSTPIEYRGNL